MFIICFLEVTLNLAMIIIPPWVACVLLDLVKKKGLH